MSVPDAARRGVAPLRRALLRPAPVSTARERAAALGVMFVVGSVSGLGALLLVGDRPVATLPLAVVVALGAPVGLAVLRVGPRLPVWAFQPLLAVGTAIVLTAARLAGTGTTPVAYLMFLVWVALYAGYFSSLIGALAHGALAIGGTAWVLSRLDQPYALEVVVFTGVAGVAAGASNWLAHGRGPSELDPLTGIPNRRGLSRTLDAAMEDAVGERTPLSVALIDLDRFRAVNEHHGHDAGDRLLVECVARWHARLPERATLARYGGDEFVLVLPGRALDAAREVVDTIRAAAPSGRTCSAGLAAWEVGDTQSLLLARADTALYRAKHEGRDRTDVEGDDPDAAGELWEAIVEGRFVLHYQPIHRVADGRLETVEALVRWSHPERGLVAPGGFMRLAERSGAIHALGRWVVEEACRQLREWRDTVPQAAQLSVSVNLSSVQLLHPHLVADVRRALGRSGIPPEALTLEVTEGVFEAGMERVTATLWELKRVGVRLAMDDFGTGYSSLARLRSLPFDVLKIDRAFVAGATDDADEDPLLAAIVHIARSLGLETVAEGVETPGQLELVASRGCTSAQGFLLGRPAPADEVLPRLGTDGPVGASRASGVTLATSAAGT